MKHIWSIICQRSIIDADSKNITLIDSLERIQITPDEDFPSHKHFIFPIRHDLVNFLIRENHDKKITLRIQRIGPSGKFLDQFEKKYNFQGKELIKIRNRIHINSIPITTSGFYTYKIQLKINNEKKFKTEAEIPLEILISKPKKSQSP